MHRVASVSDDPEDGMIRKSWRTRLKGSISERDVLAVVAGFLSEWSRTEIWALPRGAWPARIATRRELLAHATALSALHSQFQGDPAALAPLQEMLLFFTHAAVAIARVAAHEGADCPGDKRRKRSGQTSRGRRATSPA